MQSVFGAAVLFAVTGLAQASEFANFTQFGYVSTVAGNPGIHVLYDGPGRWTGSYTHTIGTGGSAFDFGSVSWDFGLTSPTTLRMFTQGSTQTDPTGSVDDLDCITFIDFSIPEDTAFSLTGLVGSTNGASIFSLLVPNGSSGAILGVPVGVDGVFEVVGFGAVQSVSYQGMLRAGDYALAAWGNSGIQGSQLLDLTMTLPSPGTWVGVVVFGVLGLRRRRG